METEREYYIAGGADLEKAEAFIEKRRLASIAMQDVAQNYGAKSCATNGRTIGGLIFINNEPPMNWVEKGRTRDGDVFFLPRRTTKENKEISKHIASVTSPSIHEFHALYSKEGGVLKEGSGLGMRVLYISWEHLGDKLLLSVPIGSDYSPDGSVPIKMSEYWTLKEKSSS